MVREPDDVIIQVSLPGHRTGGRKVKSMDLERQGGYQAPERNGTFYGADHG